MRFSRLLDRDRSLKKTTENDILSEPCFFLSECFLALEQHPFRWFRVLGMRIRVVGLKMGGLNTLVEGKDDISLCPWVEHPSGRMPEWSGCLLSPALDKGAEVFSTSASEAFFI